MFFNLLILSKCIIWVFSKLNPRVLRQANNVLISHLFLYIFSATCGLSLVATITNTPSSLRSSYRYFRSFIILILIIDATNILKFRTAKKLEQEAKSWIFGGSESFKETCLEGGIEPSFVVRVTKAIIKLHKDKSRLRKPSQQNPVDSKNKKNVI